MTITYTDSTGNYKLIKDVYDNSSILSQSGLGPADHPTNYTVPVGTENTIQINMSSITGLTALDTTSLLKIRTYMKDGNTSTLLNIEADNNLPKQIRKVQGRSYYTSLGASSSAPVLITQIPLAERLPGIFDYVIRAESAVNK
jgi:hypothetical protein